jgi:hypothetical protein
MRPLRVNLCPQFKPTSTNYYRVSRMVAIASDYTIVVPPYIVANCFGEILLFPGFGAIPFFHGNIVDKLRIPGFPRDGSILRLSHLSGLGDFPNVRPTPLRSFDRLISFGLRARYTPALTANCNNKDQRNDERADDKHIRITIKLVPRTSLTTQRCAGYYSRSRHGCFCP